MYHNRLKKLQILAQQKRLGALFVTSPQNVTYLSGFRGLCSTDVLVPCLTDPEVVLFITKDNAYTIADGRYTEAVRTILGFEYMPLEKNIATTLRVLCASLGIRKLGVEYKALRAIDLHAMQKILRGIAITDVSHFIPELRKEKDAEEIKTLTTASQVTDAGFTALLEYIRPGMTEGTIAHFLIDFFHRHADGPSFAPIVASGKGAAIPHYRTSNTKKIRHEEMLLLDFGAQVDGYHADMSRTIFIGEATARFKKIYALVLNAQEKTIVGLHIGMRGNDADAIARKILATAGYKKEFSHSTGHGVGLQIHENPRLSPLSKDIVKVNHVFTVEPGLYFPSWGGVRIEDTILLAKKGPRVLTRSSKKLITLLPR